MRNSVKTRVLTKVILFLAGFFFASTAILHAAGIEAPVILEVERRTQPFTNQYLVEGLTPGGSNALVYVDGEYSGNASTNDTAGSQDSFAYVTGALPDGKHTIKVIAQDEYTKELSAPVDYTFTVYSENDPVENPALVSPVVISPAQGQNMNSDKVQVSGLVHNGKKALIYLDGDYVGKTDFINGDSKEVGFYYTIYDVPAGSHFVQAKTRDRNGDDSKLSEKVHFSVLGGSAQVADGTDTSDGGGVGEGEGDGKEDKDQELFVLPQPSVLMPADGIEIGNDDFIVAGKARKSDMVKVFINDDLFCDIEKDEFKHDFTCMPDEDLVPGKHSLYVLSLNEEGAESPRSVEVEFTIKSPQISATSTEDKVSEDEGETDEEAGTSSEDEDGTSTPPAISDQMDVIFFTLLLIAIMIWIIAVNRDTIRKHLSKVAKKARIKARTNKTRRPKSRRRITPMTRAKPEMTI